jgi:DNA-3-methyladenine glycosylase I
MPEAPRVEALTDERRSWATRVLTDAWGSPVMVSPARTHQADRLPAFVAVVGDELVGLLTYAIEGDACEVVTLNSLREGIGAGSALIHAATTAARAAGCRRLWLLTTNDNLHALGFYQRRGLRLVALRAGAVDAARQFKPEMPVIGLNGIPLRDEIELELVLKERMDDDAKH